ncbi:outer membrane beta-barrel protein [Chryseolinea lacunae]|uniref:Outer membrane beta-barrel protein n=1 Tax=Chryseolinea lacunae TaxID=2801331 RepID=A0ABS1KZA4_9BACT|nr:outer membrane beta-barrel protein [Chryseolinea lacunae]MBL0744567.1 outer membrane beta-barrel protein [Chryseolinea lacunae]
MKKNALLILLFVSVGTLPALGQALKGKIQDVNGAPLPFVNVLLLASKDSLLVKGVLSDTSGVYAIDHVMAGTYLLKVTMVGYKQVNPVPVNVTGDDEPKSVIITLTEDSRQLDEVVVTEKRPFVEQHLDRMVVNVANSIIASGSTALEVLEKAPGVTVDRQNGMLQLQGKDGVTVQLDGKQTYMAMADLITLLSTMSSDNIDKIELVTNPSSKYDAAGNSGIINIRLKKNNSVGTNGSLSLGAGTGYYDRERGSVQVNHRTKGMNFFGNYSVNRGGNYFDLETHQTVTRNETQNFADKSTYVHLMNSGHNAKAGVDYFLSQNTTIGVVWTGFWNDNGEAGTAESYFRKAANGPVYLQALTDKTIDNVSSNQIGNVNVQHTFGAKGGQLSADVDVARYVRTFSNALHTTTSSPGQPVQPLTGLLMEMPTTIDIRTAKIDYNRTIATTWKLESGVKSSYVYSDNNLTLSQGEDGHLTEDVSQSNHFQYTEQVNAAYASVSGKAGKAQLQLGVRAEHTHSVGNSITLNNKVVRDYLNFFPALFVSRPLSAHHTLTLSYSYRIDRPNYQSLNPARSYADPYLYSQGNAYLVPQYTHSLELKHGFHEKLFTSLSASFINDMVSYLVQPVDSVITERIPLNIGKAQSYSLTVSFPISVMKGWNVQTNFLGVYSRFDYLFQGTPVLVQQVSGRFNASNTFVLGHGWTAEATGWVRTPSAYAQSRAPWLGSLDLGLQKAVTPRLQAKLSLQDVFHSNRFIGKMDNPNFKSNYRLAFDTRVVMLNLTYSFGNQQLKRARQRSTGSEDETQRTN